MNSRSKTQPLFKVCTKCGEQKPQELFTINSRNGHFRSPCKACTLLQTNAWRNRNKDKVNARARVRNKSEKSREQLRERMRRWRQRHPDGKKADNDKRRIAAKTSNNQSTIQN